MHPADLNYSPQHIWLKNEGEGEYRLGITYRYQQQIKNVVFLELPSVGARLSNGEAFGAIESSKISTDLISPITGIVTTVNTAITEKPGMVNKDPYGEGWLITVKSTDTKVLQSLWSSSQYLAATADESDRGECQPQN